MEQQDFSAKQSLQLIESMIGQAQNRLNENGHLYLLWGWVIFLCSVISFVSVHFFEQLKYLNQIWLLTLPTALYQMIYMARHKKQRKVTTYTDEISTYVWIVFVIMGGLSAWIIGKSGFQQLFNPVILMLYGMPTFLSGVLLRFAPLRYGAVVCWILAAVSMLLAPSYSFLLLALAVVAAWIVPGYLLRLRFNHQK